MKRDENFLLILYLDDDIMELCCSIVVLVFACEELKEYILIRDFQ
jgi:hypothetical protein